jgi:hypothetical protein
MFKLKYHRHRGGVGETHPPERSGRDPRSASRFIPMYRWPALPRRREPAVVSLPHRSATEGSRSALELVGYNLDPTMPRSATATSAGLPVHPIAPRPAITRVKGSFGPSRFEPKGLVAGIATGYASTQPLLISI